MKYVGTAVILTALFALLASAGCAKQQDKPIAAPPSQSPAAMARFSAGRAQSDANGLAAMSQHEHMTAPPPGAQAPH